MCEYAPVIIYFYTLIDIQRFQGFICMTILYVHSAVIHIDQVYNSKIEFQINNFALNYEFFPL